MVVIVTGAIGIGKTTVCRKAASLVRSRGLSCGGFLTSKAGDGLVIEDLPTGERADFASTGPVFDGPRAGRFWFNPEGIAFGLRAIGQHLECSVLFVDELGPLELEGRGFAALPDLVGAHPETKWIVVIRDYLLDAFLPRLPTATVFRTTRENRDILPGCILSFLCCEHREPTQTASPHGAP